MTRSQTGRLVPAYLTAALLCSSFVFNVSAQIYAIKQNNVGSTFYTNFQFENVSAANGARQLYVNGSTAIQNNLTYADNDTFIMRIDDTANIDPNGPGRMSVRLKSNATYTQLVTVFDIRHIPVGCATWPAIWMNDDSVGIEAGEIDILEGINSYGTSTTQLHTQGNCTMPDDRQMSGNATSTQCATSALQDDNNGRNGCSVSGPYSSTFGPTFNTNGGGWYAMERSPEGVSVWFWARFDKSVPKAISNGTDTLNTTQFGTPIATFPNTSTCNFAQEFSAHHLLLDISLCGSWAGVRFNADGCAGDCVTYVNTNGSSFGDAYWDFAAARIYLPSNSSNSSGSGSGSGSSSGGSSSDARAVLVGGFNSGHIVMIGATVLTLAAGVLSLL
ncbi:putative beta-glucanase from glycoside hydrolase family GH16 [Obba rivulosa]|uniref:Putative beta-glucanase from glycoside hydrolase family GH16 n=1 Tax=Obba rivulosa TaxID=1052685 RepID=A0A8E2DIX9_9APHY|nr:putative beta-glucanase from glycoside hydrolase family GH16 [Obba rivulosa]